jgi:methylase of polypeptide subunit release factors
LQRTREAAHCAVPDLGTGAISLVPDKERSNRNIAATDAREAALGVAREIAKRHSMPDIEFLRRGWIAAVAGEAYANRVVVWKIQTQSKQDS